MWVPAWLAGVKAGCAHLYLYLYQENYCITRRKASKMINNCSAVNCILCVRLVLITNYLGSFSKGNRLFNSVALALEADSRFRGQYDEMFVTFVSYASPSDSSSFPTSLIFALCCSSLLGLNWELCPGFLCFLAVGSYTSTCTLQLSCCICNCKNIHNLDECLVGGCLFDGPDREWLATII